MVRYVSQRSSFGEASERLAAAQSVSSMTFP